MLLKVVVRSGNRIYFHCRRSNQGSAPTPPASPHQSLKSTRASVHLWRVELQNVS